MAAFLENSSKFFSSSSSESRESIDAISGRDEEFYEEIEAPKFVDFTSPNHYHPDDRYWFCLRVGCDQKHEEEMDSEAIYKNFVLRVMAARSPNVRFRKALDRNASRPIKCPHSAPPKSSKPRISRMAIISSISEKIIDTKKRVVRSLLKPDATPVTKTKPVAAKYLTTPRNKNCPPKRSPFRSVQNPKPANIEVSKCQTVAKALVFRSPKKMIKVKTSVELRTPVTRLCEGMSKLDISSQRKSVLGCSSKSSKSLASNASRRLLGSRKVQSKPEKQVNSESCIKHEAKSIISRSGTTKGKLSKQLVSKKLLRSDRIACSITNEGQEDSKHELVTEKVSEDLKVQESTQEASSTVPQSPIALDLASSDHSKAEERCLELEGSNHPKSVVTSTEENKASDKNELNDGIGLTSESCRHSENQQNENNSPEGKKNGLQIMDSDDKENAAASDQNRMHNSNQKHNGRRIFGIHEKGGEVKKVVQTVDKHLKESHLTSAPVMKFKKPKPTNPKPFRLRTDERGILKEANLEKRINQEAAKSETANSSILSRKLPKKHKNDVHIEGMVVGVKPPKEQKKSNTEASVTPDSHRAPRNEQPKQMNTPVRSNSVRRLEKKTTSRHQNQSVQPQGLVSTKKETAVPFLIPGQKLDVIHEASPEVTELRKALKPTENNAAPTIDAAAMSSSRGRRRPVTVAVEPSFHSTNVPRSCTKKLK